jgi:hypothetical protein
MSGFVALLYRLARLANDISKLASGDPKKIVKRGGNKVLGRKLHRRFWFK